MTDETKGEVDQSEVTDVAKAISDFAAERCYQKRMVVLACLRLAAIGVARDHASALAAVAHFCDELEYAETVAMKVKMEGLLESIALASIPADKLGQA